MTPPGAERQPEAGDEHPGHFVDHHHARVPTAGVLLGHCRAGDTHDEDHCEHDHLERRRRRAHQQPEGETHRRPGGARATGTWPAGPADAMMGATRRRSGVTARRPTHGPARRRSSRRPSARPAPRKAAKYPPSSSRRNAARGTSGNVATSDSGSAAARSVNATTAASIPIRNQTVDQRRAQSLADRRVAARAIRLPAGVVVLVEVERRRNRIGHAGLIRPLANPVCRPAAGGRARREQRQRRPDGATTRPRPGCVDAHLHIAGCAACGAGPVGRDGGLSTGRAGHPDIIVRRARRARRADPGVRP